MRGVAFRGDLLRLALRVRPLLLAQHRQPGSTRLLDALEGLPGEAIGERKLIAAMGAGDPNVRRQQEFRGRWVHVGSAPCNLFYQEAALAQWSPTLRQYCARSR